MAAAMGPRDDGFWTRTRTSGAMGHHPKKGCCMTTVAHRGKIYLYGGGMIESFYEDVFEMDVTTGVWTKLDVDRSNGVAPTPTLSHTAVVHDNRMIVFGGMGNFNCVNTVYSLSLAPTPNATLEWNELALTSAGDTPSARKGHAACVWNDRMYVFMGADFRGFSLSDIWYFDLKKHVWVRVHSVDAEDTKPAPRSRTGHSVDVLGGKAYIFGGMHQARGAAYQWLRDLWSWDFETHTWTEVAAGDALPAVGTPVTSPVVASLTPMSPPVASPPVESLPPPAVDVASPLGAPGDEMESIASITPEPSDIECSSPSAADAVTRGPPGRYSHVSWVAGRGVYVFGGDTNNCSKYFNDLWRFDLDAMVWEELHLPGDAPSPRSGHVATIWAGCVYIFGGEKPLKVTSPTAELSKAYVQHSVGYSNSVFALPQFADANTTLVEIAARRLLKVYGLVNLKRYEAELAIGRLPLPPPLRAALLRLLPLNPSVGRKHHRLLDALGASRSLAEGGRQGRCGEGGAPHEAAASSGVEDHEDSQDGGGGGVPVV